MYFGADPDMVRYVEFLDPNWSLGVSTECMVDAGVIDAEHFSYEGIINWLEDRYKIERFGCYYAMKPSYLCSSWEEFDEKVKMHIAKLKVLGEG